MAPKRKIVKSKLGTVKQVSGEDIEIAELVGDAPAPDVGVQLQHEQLVEERRAEFDTMGDKALTFAEGVVDAVTLGLVHGHGEKAEIRRDVNSGSALLGQLVGTAGSLGLPGSPIARVAGGSKAVGKSITNQLLSEATRAKTAGKILDRAVEEAAIGAGLMGSTAFGHQLSDAIIEDKAFAGEAVLHEMTLGGALGFGTGLLAGGFSALVTRGKIKAQGGVVDGASQESKSLVDEIKGVQGAWKEAAGKYEMQAGVLESLHRKGVIPEEVLKPYRDAARAARRAVDDLDNYSPAAMLDAGPKEYAKFRKAMERARKGVDDADEIFKSPPSEARPQALSVKQGEDLGLPRESYPTGVQSGWGQELDDAMRASPELRAQYEQLHGRQWEFLPGGERARVGMDDAIAGRMDDVAAPEAGTVAGKGKRGRDIPEQVPPAVPELQAGPGAVNRINGGVTGAVARGEMRTLGGGSATRLESATQVVPEGIPTRQVNVLDPDAARAARGYIPEPAPRPSDIGLLPDNALPVVKSVDDNAMAFAQYREASAEALEMEARTVKDPGVLRGEPASAPTKTYKDPFVPKGEPLPKAQKAPKEQAVPEESIVDETTQVRPPKPGDPAWDEFQRRAAERYVEGWYWESKVGGVRPSPADEAAVRLDGALRRLSEATGGRLDSAGALELGERLGLKPTQDMFVDRLDQVWALRKAAKFAADEARGVATPLRSSARGMVDEVARRYMAKQGAAILGGIMGGPLGAAGGWVLGKHLPGMLGFGAKAAASAGRIMELVGKAGDDLLKGRRGTVVARAVAGNRPYAYDDEGPVKDPVDRIQKIHRVAANPDQIRATVRNQLGDVALAAPQFASALEEAAVRQMTNLSIKAPAIYFDQLGRAISPTAGALRRFYEYENSTHDLPALLAAVGRGATSPEQLAALAEQHPAAHGYLVKRLLTEGPDRLKKLTSAELRSVEAVMGVPLSYAAMNPGHVARFQSGWAQSMAQPPAQAGKPQAFKITTPTPTPAQAGSKGVAPGNEQ